MANMYDIVIIGGGPGGYSAGLYAARAGLHVAVLEKQAIGGQAIWSENIENYPGFDAGIDGLSLSEKMQRGAERFGAEMVTDEVCRVRLMQTVKIIEGAKQTYRAPAVILATGARHRRLGLDREESFIGNGISFCAVCDGAFYSGRTVAVIGGGNSALQEALLLSDLASHVYVVQNLDFLTGEPALQDQLRARENVTVLTGRVVSELLGGEELTGIRIRKVDDGQIEELALDGLFIAIGLVPQNQIFAETVPLDAGGYINADEHCTANKRGVFVAGDCRRKQIRQVTTAAADGAVAALAACEYLKKA